MARPFGTKEAKLLITEHRELLSQLEEAASALQTCRENIKQYSDLLAAQSVLTILRDIPVEEINNREKRSFRVKTLRENGYQTIADIVPASVHALASVYGISEDAACSIKRIVNEMASQAGQGCKIRLSTDNQSKEASDLVSAICRFRQLKPLSASAAQTADANRSDISTALADLEPVNGTLKWLFASKEKKRKAMEAFCRLTELRIDNYGAEAAALTAEYQAIQNSTVSDAWKDFSADPVSYFNVLEEINPGLLGNDDALYGLPEELAREIQDECWFPDGLLCELRRYQQWGVKYILHQERVLLGDEMGLGKTVQAIAAMVSLKNTGASHFLVVCPASVITNWCREIRKMSRLTVIKIHGCSRTDAFQSWLKTGGVAVTTYETTAYCTLPDAFRFSMLVVDEAHYIKNPEAKRTKNVRALCTHAERLLFMTGTALENRAGEMVSLIRMLQPDIGSRIENMTYMASAPQFRKTIAPVYYRRKREDVLTELPDLIESREWCTMSPAEEAAYEQAVLSGNYTESRRVSWNVPDLNDSSKAARLLELVNDAEADGRKVIVFSFFLDTIRKITLLLGKRCLDPITGAVPPQRRQELIDSFDQAPPGTVLAAQIQSGGTGLNIQSASVVILCEPQLKPSVENQAISRAYRMGQTRNVLVYRLLCEDSVDERITALLEEKQAVFDAFADQSEAANDSQEIDEHTFGDIIREEIDRINAKRK
ncbi:MAG: DEAD/DEAH box helicase family protein [Oscillospiraceae bacterium]|nr:DEAD/DEAH box helicase family protein [Oscillospiraceae bacterium]